jgi:hypothetical protein
MSEERFERIETHHNFWNLKTTLYSIEGKVLPIPISSTSVFYYGCIFMLVILISKVPGLKLILELPYIENPMIKYIGIPVFLGYFLEHIKLDGKAPYIYLLDLIRFSISPKVFEQFKEIKIPKSKKINKKVKFRVEEKTSIMLKGKIDKKKYRYMHEYL